MDQNNQLIQLLDSNKSYLESFKGVQISRARFESGLLSNVYDQFEDTWKENKSLRLDIYSCALRAAHQGLIPGVHCTIVSRFDKQNRCHRAVLYLMYQGIVHRINEMPNVEIASPQIIYEGDEFEMPRREMTGNGWDVKFSHEQLHKTDEVKYVYVMWAVNGKWDVTIVSRLRLDQVAAENPKSLAWKNAFGEMGKKHVIKVAVKYLDIDPGFQAMVNESAKMEVEGGVVDDDQVTVPEDRRVSPPEEQIKKPRKKRGRKPKVVEGETVTGSNIGLEGGEFLADSEGGHHVAPNEEPMYDADDQPINLREKKALLKTKPRRGPNFGKGYTKDDVEPKIAGRDTFGEDDEEEVF